MRTATAYADESGHSGGKYDDADQPVFVTAGWVVPHACETSLSAALAAFGGRQGGVGAEVKFGKAVKRASARERIATLTDDIMSLGCEPVVDAWEKRFGIATRIVDVFLDIDFNRVAARYAPPHDKNRVKSAYFLDRVLPDDCLRNFAVAFQAADVAGLRAAQQRICGLVLLAGQPNLAALIEACDVEAAAADMTPDMRHHRTLNFPSFLAFLGMVDRTFERLDGRGPFVFDDQEEFRASFDEAHGMLAGANAVDFVAGDHSFRMGFSRIDSYGMASSDSTPGIQAADALAALVRFVLTNPEEVVAGSATWSAVRRVFGLPQTGIERFGNTSRLTAGEALHRRVGALVFALPDP